MTLTLVLPFATDQGEYYEIPGTRLGITQNVFFEKNIRQTVKNFKAARHVSIFKQIATLSAEPIYIGGTAKTAIPESEFQKIIKAIPTDYELEKYVSARVSVIVRNYLEHAKDGAKSYDKYISRKPTKVPTNIRLEFAEYEIYKYQELYQRLNQMLESENDYSEITWQEGIKNILLLIFPQYLKAFREAPIYDGGTSSERYVDFLLVDSSGVIDLLEIKKPFDMCVVTASTYRGNYIPLKELSGSVMQVEKYLFNLTRSGRYSERKLNKKYASELPNGLQIKVTNPRGIILIGRDNNLSEKQKIDFEVIRRKYKNIVDILTYDDLLRRVNAIIGQFKLSEGI